MDWMKECDTEIPASPDGNQLISRIDELVSNASKWDNYNAWVESKEREQFYDIVGKIEERKSKESEKRDLKLDWDDIESYQATPKNAGTQFQQDNTAATIQLLTNSTQTPQEIKRKAINAQKFLFSTVPLSIVCLRRRTPKSFPVITHEGRKYYEVNNLSELSYLMFFDMFKTMNFEAFCSYKQFILLSDLTWISNNKTLPRSHKFLTDAILKKFVIDYYVLVEKYSTRQILENYDLEFVLDAYFRAVMVSKGCKNEGVMDFREEVSMEDWLDHHERSCGIKGKWRGRGRCESDGELQLDMQGFQLIVQKRGGKFLVSKDS